jgi:uncharacterized protein (TIRG00374 family)
MTRINQRTIIAVTLTVFVVLAILVIVLNWQQVVLIGGKAQWEQALAALLFTIISYVSLSLGYALVNRLFGIKIKWWRSFEIGIISTVLNNVLGFLGAAGHSMRVGLIKGQENDPAEILAASIFHSYLNNVMLILMLTIGLVTLLVSQAVYGGSAVVLGIAAVLMVLSLVISTVIIFIPQVKSFIFSLIKMIWHFLTRRDISPFLANFDHGLTEGLTALKRHPEELFWLLILMAGEWAFQAVALWFCFDAFGNVPTFAVLLSGFGVGLSVGGISMIPGGLGTQDVSMAGIFSALGMSFANTVLVVILFRIVSDFIPLCMSLPTYVRIIRRI